MASSAHVSECPDWEIDLVANDSIRASTPFRTEARRLVLAEKTFTKFVKIDKGIPYRVLVQIPQICQCQYQEVDPNLKWLAVTVRRSILGRTPEKVTRTAIFNLEDNHENRGILLEDEKFVTWNDDQYAWFNLNPNAINFTDTPERHGRIPAVFGKYQFCEFPNEHEIVVSIHQAQSQDSMSPDDVLLRQFRLYCKGAEDYRLHIKSMAEEEGESTLETYGLECAGP